jgi:hypothetical protein
MTDGIAWRPAAQEVRGAVLAPALMVMLVIALQFGPAIGLLGFRFTGDMRWALIGLSRDVLVVALVAVGGLSASTAARRLPSSARWALAVVAAYGLFALASSSGLILTALNLRRLALVPLLYVAVLLIPWSRAQIDFVMRLIVVTSVLVAVLGLVERFAPTRLWTELLDIDRFNAANPLDRFGTIAFEDSGRFFSWDLERWTGTPLRRAVSTFLEPTTLAAAMSVALVLLLAQRARGHGTTLAWLLVLACGLLTLAKSFALFMLLLIPWRLFGAPSPRQALALTGSACVLALALDARGLTDGPLAHFAGLASALRYLGEGHLFGEGVGAAGNYANTDSDIGGESGLGNAISQVGIAAVLPLLWVRAAASEALQAARVRRDPGGPWIASWLLFWLLSYLLSASSLGVSGNALGFAMLALYLHSASQGRAR